MRRRFLKQSIAVITFAIAAIANAQSPPAATKITFAKYVQTRTHTILDELQTGNNWKQAARSAEDLFDIAAIYASEDRPDGLREADLNLRLVTQLAHAPEDCRIDLLKLLRASPNLTAGLVYMMRPDESRPDVFALLNRLRKQRPAQVEAFASLTASIALVHAKPFDLDINDNKAKAIDPLDLFDFYVRNEGRMMFGIRNVPPELLVYVVDDTGSIDDMNWALAKYQGTRDVGRLFFNIQYDVNSFFQGTTKQVSLRGYTLPNILRYGGVCADQAYFSTQVGKSIGVPTAYTFGESSEAAHAWVGFLQSSPRGIVWNFDSGRYDAYRGVRGNVLEPVSRKYIPDTFLSLTAEMIGTTPAARQNAAALSDAARRLMSMEKDRLPAPEAPPEIAAETIRRQPRSADAETELTLLQAALRQSVGCADAWFAVRELALADELSPADKGKWADLMIGFGAKKYPDFTLSVLAPMVETVPNPVQQDVVWNKLFAIFQSRVDLAAEVRMEEAAMWDKQGQEDKADICYRDVINRFANAGPFIIGALLEEEKVYVKAKRPDLILPLYDQAFKKIQQPDNRALQFMVESNWYRVGRMYSDKLREAGQTANAARIEHLLADAAPAAR